MCPQALASAAPKAPSIATLRKDFLAEVTPVNTALVIWKRKINALPPSATWAQLGKIDQPFANALTKFDGELMRFRETATVNAPVGQFVVADQQLIADLTSAVGQSRFTGGTWETATLKDERGLVNAEAALRQALGLAAVH